jgi:pimeloyl-ACP methyl ester carboxylesterase
MIRFLIAAAAIAVSAPAMAEPTRFSVVTVGTGPDVILIPGLSSPRAVWQATADRLKSRHRVHLIQLKGFGELAGPNASGPVLKPFVDELGAYIADRKLKRPALVGHSMGGLAALMLAIDRPALPGKVMVVDALPFIGPLFGAASVDAIRPQAAQMRTMLIGNAARVTPDHSPPDCPASLPAPAAPRGTMTNSGQGGCLVRYGAMASDLRVVAQAMYDDMVTDLTPRLGRIEAPVTMLYPQDDRLLTPAAAAKVYGDAYAGLPSAKLVPVTGSYHFIMQDQPAKFAAALDAFLKR